MPSNFQRLKSGQHFRVNEPTARSIIEVAEDWSRHNRDPGQIDPPEYLFEGSVIQCRNDSACPFARFSVVGFASALIPPAGNLLEFQNYPRFALRVPISSDAGRFGICIEPIDSGAVGRVLVVGVAAVRILLSAGAGRPLFADVHAGAADLLPAASGAQVLFCDSAPISGSSDVWALVRIPFGDSSATSNTTTSTTTTTTAPPCAGKCRMTWSVATQTWSITSNACGTPTTTTSTSTTSTTGGGTSTTTTTPFGSCAAMTSTTSTTGGGTSTTTTTPPPCQCQYPPWCGSFDGECTDVYCAPVASSPSPPPCASTT